MIDIRLAERTSKERRANIYRKYTYINEGTSKAETNYKFIGSFRIFVNDEDELTKLSSLLEPEEILQLQNWVAEILFFKEHFNTDPDDLKGVEIQIPESFYQKIYKLYIEAKRVNIEFIPHKVMLESLFKKALIVQDRINNINKTNIKIFDDLLLQQKEHESRDEDSEAKVLFKTLLTLPQPIGKTCSELELASIKYRDNEAKIPPPLLREWAGDMPNRNPNKRVKKWAYAAAIDVLIEHNINPTILIPPEKIAKYWGLQKKLIYSLIEAEKIFFDTFSVSTEKIASVKVELKNIFSRG